MNCKEFLEYIKELDKLEIVFEYECTCGKECKYDKEIYYETNRFLDFEPDAFGEERKGRKVILKLILKEF